MKFPDDLLWGSASADMQYEGGFGEGGRLPTTHDYITAGNHNTSRKLTYKMLNGNYGSASVRLGKDATFPEQAIPTLMPDEYYPSHQAVDFYHRYKEDIKLLADMGLNCMRFSICWSRVFPTGEEDTPNEEGIKFYENVVDECFKNGIQPLITICHDELPVALAEKYGGWLSRRTIDCYLKLCRVLFERLHKVKYWLTFNEVNLLTGYSRLGAKKDSLQNKYQCVHHIFLASSLAIKLGREIIPNAMFGAMFAMSPAYPETCNPEDIWAWVEQGRTNFFYSDVMIRGYYPSYQDFYFDENNICIDMEKDDAEIIGKYNLDYISFSCYRSTTASAGNKNYAESMLRNPYLEKTPWGWAIDPISLRFACTQAWDRYQVPVFIVENGLGFEDEPDENLYVQDDYRIKYLNDHFKEIKKAVEEDGVNILGYTMWGGIDLVSLSTGEMKKRYGWIYVDMDDMGNGTKNRIPKKSYYWMKDFLALKGGNLA
nr:family 1 glycosylhydrolase [uncultured Trichococcus sp.]